MCRNDPHGFAYMFIKGHRLDYAKVDLVENLPPNVAKTSPMLLMSVV